MKGNQYNHHIIRPITWSITNRITNLKVRSTFCYIVNFLLHRFLSKDFDFKLLCGWGPKGGRFFYEGKLD